MTPTTLRLLVLLEDVMRHLLELMVYERSVAAVGSEEVSEHQPEAGNDAGRRCEGNEHRQQRGFVHEQRDLWSPEEHGRIPGAELSGRRRRLLARASNPFEELAGSMQNKHGGDSASARTTRLSKVCSASSPVETCGPVRSVQGVAVVEPETAYQPVSAGSEKSGLNCGFASTRPFAVLPGTGSSYGVR
jgi:hypothetical protein